MMKRIALKNRIGFIFPIQSIVYSVSQILFLVKDYCKLREIQHITVQNNIQIAYLYKVKLFFYGIYYGYSLKRFLCF